MDELDLSFLDDETRRGAEIHWQASQSAYLFTNPSESMLMDNFQSLRDGILPKLKKRYPKAKENELDDMATELAMKLDPEGFRAIEKWADMQEAFRLQK